MLLKVLAAFLFLSAVLACDKNEECKGSNTICQRGNCVEFYCKPNMHYVNCGTPCQPTCLKPNPHPCGHKCYAGCICNDGYLSDGQGGCVPKIRCPKYFPICGVNEFFTQCGNPCEPSCTNQKPTSCEKKCLLDVCQCNTGFYRHETKGCITADNCKCSTNEVFVPCNGSPTIECEPSCEVQNPTGCTVRCSGVGSCRCEPGSVRHKSRGCIKPTQCTNKICGPNSYFTTCGSACEPNCTNPNPKSCSQKCVPDVCRCDPGYYRHESGDCVPLVMCRTAICGDNEHFAKCGTACEKTCEEPNPKECSTKCVTNVCQCNTGYYRHKTKGCVRLHDCALECGKNEHFTRCGSACEPTCENPKPKICSQQCILNMCECDKGFFRNLKRQCVPFNECDCNQNHRDNRDSYERDFYPES